MTHDKPSGAELKACPFCGSEPLFIVGGPDLVGIQCNSARCVNPHISNVSEAFARELWNTRSLPQAGGGVEALARVLAIPEHHTGYDRLPEADKDLYRMQAEYALGHFAALPPAGRVEEENRELRKIIAELGYCTPDASLDFMRLIPAEIRTALTGRELYR